MPVDARKSTPLCARVKRDPRDQMNWLLEQLEDSDFAADRVFYLNGFTDFTGQQSAVLRHFIEMSEKVVVSLTCDEPGSKDPSFEKAGETAAQLLRFAKELGVGKKEVGYMYGQYKKLTNDFSGHGGGDAIMFKELLKLLVRFVPPYKKYFLLNLFFKKSKVLSKYKCALSFLYAPSSIYKVSSISLNTSS